MSTFKIRNRPLIFEAPNFQKLRKLRTPNQQYIKRLQLVIKNSFSKISPHKEAFSLVVRATYRDDLILMYLPLNNAGVRFTKV